MEGQREGGTEGRKEVSSLFIPSLNSLLLVTRHSSIFLDLYFQPEITRLPPLPHPHCFPFSSPFPHVLTLPLSPFPSLLLSILSLPPSLPLPLFPLSLSHSLLSPFLPPSLHLFSLSFPLPSQSQIQEVEEEQAMRLAAAHNDFHKALGLALQLKRPATMASLIRDMSK